MGVVITELMVKDNCVTYTPQPFSVRVVYVVPTGIDPWSETQRRATEWLEDMQWFLADEMNRLGYGKKSFNIATDEGGALVFHQINSSLSSAQFGNDPKKNCKHAAQERNLRSMSKDEVNDVIVYFYEWHKIADGEVIAGSRGEKRRLGGEAFLSSLHLKMARREWISSDSGYGGRVFDYISPLPLKGSELSWNGRGKKLGDVSGAAFGIMAHELGHCFGLSNDKSNMSNVSLMGNGCRRMRGHFRPDLTADRCFLSEESAAVLDKSDFFALRTLKPKSKIFCD